MKSRNRIVARCGVACYRIGTGKNETFQNATVVPGWTLEAHGVEFLVCPLVCLLEDSLFSDEPSEAC